MSPAEDTAKALVAGKHIQLIHHKRSDNPLRQHLMAHKKEAVGLMCLVCGASDRPIDADISLTEG